MYHSSCSEELRYTCAVPFRSTALELWRTLDPTERLEASKAIWSRPEGAVEAVAALAQLWRMRPPVLLRTPIERRASALSGLARPSESLALSLLAALHLVSRRPLLVAFLDELGVPHQEGLLNEDLSTDLPEPSRLVSIGLGLATTFGTRNVEVYWNCLWLQDRESWAPLESAWNAVESELRAQAVASNPAPVS